MLLHNYVDLLHGKPGKAHGNLLGTSLIIYTLSHKYSSLSLCLTHTHARARAQRLWNQTKPDIMDTENEPAADKS